MIGVSDPVQAQSPTKYEPIADLSGTTMMVEARPAVSESVFLEKGQLNDTNKNRYREISVSSKSKIFKYFKLALDNPNNTEKEFKKAANGLVIYFFEIEKKMEFIINPQGGYFGDANSLEKV